MKEESRKIASIRTYTISFLSRLRNNIDYSNLEFVDIRVNGVRCRRRDEFYSYPLLMGRWFAVFAARLLLLPSNTRVRTDHVCTAVYATIQTQPCPVSPMSDVAILTDPSRRYSEIYGDATVGT